MVGSTPTMDQPGIAAQPKRSAGDSLRSPMHPVSAHPFALSNSLIELLPDEEADDACSDEDDGLAGSYPVEQSPGPRRSSLHQTPKGVRRSRSLPTLVSGPGDDRRSIFSTDIWLGDHSEASSLFAAEVAIKGWTAVGDPKRGGYIVYDCSIRTRDGATIHIHKRYSAFDRLYESLMTYLPRGLSSQVRKIPPKAAFARFRPVFLEKRRRLLQDWLMGVMLHPDLGGNKLVKEWVME
ncbi:hypothetical protein DL93DRAFT_2083283 [Clavulina sp. PMI_390]|nr:hypothetical protein DL93DRAFT_2083283 [Clavulina sp. PMI_390]